MHFLAEALFKPKTIEAEIIRMNEKYRTEGKDLSQREEGVELATIAQNAAHYSKLFAKSLKKGEYQIQPARLVEIETNGKKRTLYLFSINDSILHGVISNTIHTYCQDEKIYSPNLKSYIKGKSHWKTLKEFAHFVRLHHQQTPKEQRGLYLLRRDIASYTDMIPVDDNSKLWPLLHKELQFPTHPTPLEERAWKYTRQVIQTEAQAKNGEIFKKTRGVPTGSPISTTLFNFYALELDRKLDSLKPAFYTRYGDDILVADTSREKTDHASRIIQTTLQDHGLESNKKKLESYFLNNAGRHPPPCNLPPGDQYPGRDRILFLGCDIKANGTVSLNKKTKNQMLQDLRERFSRIDLTLPEEERLKKMCQSVAFALNPKQPLCHKTAILLRYNVTDRQCLHDLDKRISMEILKALTGSSSPKGYRQTPIREMRKHGLPSLVAIRNKEK
jgi:hypothetical protein